MGLHAIEWLITIPPVAGGLAYLGISRFRRARKDATTPSSLDAALTNTAPGISRRQSSWTEDAPQPPTTYNGLS